MCSLMIHCHRPIEQNFEGPLRHCVFFFLCVYDHVVCLHCVSTHVCAGVCRSQRLMTSCFSKSQFCLLMQGLCLKVQVINQLVWLASFSWGIYLYLLSAGVIGRHHAHLALMWALGS